MKITRKVTSIVLALLLAVSAFAGLAITVNAANTDMPEGPYTLQITKYNIPQDAADETQKNTYIGNTDTLTGTYFDDPNTYGGKQYELLDGVTFTMVKVAEVGETKTLEEAAAIYANAASDTKISATTGKVPAPAGGGYIDRPGVAILQTTEPGLYYVVESAKPASVTTSSAPFLVYLPMSVNFDSNQTVSTAYAGQTWLNQVNVYPKNLTTLGGATLTKTINGQQIKTFSSEVNLVQNPKFKLVEYDPSAEEGQREGKVIKADIEINKNFSSDGLSPDELKTAANVVSPGDLAAPYDTVTIAQKWGTIAVDGLPVGTYAFIETTPAQLVAGVDLPMDTTPRVFEIKEGYNVSVGTVPAGQGMNFGSITKNSADNGTYEFTVDNSEEPTIKKYVQVSRENYGVKTTTDGGAYRLGDGVIWTIEPDIPADIATYQTFKVTDTIDTRLEFAGTTAVVVAATDENDEDVDLVEGTDYSKAYDSSTRILTVEFTEDGRKELATATSLEITVTTSINDTAAADAKIYNSATLTFQNSFQTSTTSKTPTETPYVYTGAFRIEKVDADDNDVKLAGVEFNLVNSITNEYVPVKQAVEGVDGVYIVDTSQSVSSTDSSISKLVTASGDVAATTTTGDNGTTITPAITKGQIYVLGLEYVTGKYKLVETKTNSGYQLLTSPVVLTVASGTGETAVTVENIKQPDLPLTGGMGTIIFIVSGLVLVGGASVMFISSIKSKKRKAQL